LYNAICGENKKLTIDNMQGGLLPSGEISSKGDILIMHSIAKAGTPQP
jgi:hypothetical protein